MQHKEYVLSNGAATLWFSQKQLVELFGVTKQNISLHIQNILEEGELNPSLTAKNFLTVENIVLWRRNNGR